MPTATCKQCGTEFQPLTKRSKYCGGICFRETERAYGRQHRAGFSDMRRKAAILTSTAIENGTLVRQPCELCGRTDTHAHHDDYAAPLDVRWLCRSHHKKHHAEFGPGLNA